jgi:hypothetical protein
VADRLCPQPRGADAIGLGERPLDTFAEAAVSERQCERQNERQQTEHAADHDTHTFGLSLSSARSAPGAKPMASCATIWIGHSSKAKAKTLQLAIAASTVICAISPTSPLGNV